MPVGAGGPPFDPSAYFPYPAAGYPTPATMPRGLGMDPWAGLEQQFLAPSAYTPAAAAATPVIPPRPVSRSHSHSRPRSRGHNDGFTPDWVGPRPGEPVVMPQSMAVPPEFAAHVAPGTPWYPAPMVHTPYTPYGAYSLPHTGYPSRHQRNRSTHTTPWHGGGFLPEEMAEHPYDRAARPELRSGMVDTRWFTGKDYGPALDPLLAGVVGCAFKINPLLAPPPEDPQKRPYLTWNMLFSSAYVHRSDERTSQSWMKGREAPATFPRLSQLRIISKSFPWFIEVKAHSRSRGVTCGDVIEAISAFLLERTGASEYNSLPQSEQTKVAASYHHNRSMADDVPGGRLGAGMLRCDFLCEDTMWGGLDVDPKYVAERLQISGRSKREANNVFVLICEKRLPMTSEERREQAARGANASRAASRAASASGAASADE
ncbi:hypothetical protein A7U60_g3854 [Sanghuangporus baumii]|uniref:DUF6699 domain-containing protein n=1 Tax=Sanghuangporus baumii TaxID=108892 RepID=A0A9Q5I007_SANBA|nr:hypothetical protein A7U60_g3854 [Sanghuangporus baumii]